MRGPLRMTGVSTVTTPDLASTDLRSSCERRCRRLLDRSELLDTSDIDWSEAVRPELEPAIVDVLVYMRDVEGFTTRYLEGLAGHPATLGDPLVAEFLGVWQREEGAHSDALGTFLVRYAEHHGIEVPARPTTPPSDPALSERLLVAASRPVGHVVTAAHMVWGALNELLTLNGYRLLASRLEGTALAVVLERIAAQEARHYAFYRLQAEWRLDASRLARAIIPRILRSSWTPVGVGDEFKAPDEFARVFAYLTTAPGADAVLRRMDGAIGQLTGLEELSPYRRLTAA